MNAAVCAAVFLWVAVLSVRGSQPASAGALASKLNLEPMMNGPVARASAKFRHYQAPVPATPLKLKFMPSLFRAARYDRRCPVGLGIKEILQIQPWRASRSAQQSA